MCLLLLLLLLQLLLLQDAKDHMRIEEKLTALSHSDDAVDLRNEHTKYISI